MDVKRIGTAAVMSIADAIEHALPALGRAGALDTLLAAYSLAAPLWQLAHPPEGLTESYAEEPEVPPDWNIDFASALTRLLPNQTEPIRAANQVQPHTDMSSGG